MDTICETEVQTHYLIPAENYERFLGDCAKLSRKAVKLGFPPIKPFLYGHEIKKLSDGYDHKVYQILFTEDLIRLEGWQFIATLDHSNDTGTILRSVPNAPPIPEFYRTAKPSCDHCNLARNRKDSYVLRCEATGLYKQVGKTCLKDFFGHDPNKIARMAELLGFADECARGYEQYESGGKCLSYIRMSEFADHCATMIRLFGWVSGKAAADRNDINSTRSAAMMNMFPSPSDHPSPVTDADRELAEKALDWAERLKDKENKSDYEHNITIIAGAQMIENRSAGLAASIVGVYVRNLEQETIRATQRASQKDSQHVGKTGERLRNISAKVLALTTRDNEFGTTYIYRFMTLEGNVLVWFASKNANVLPGASVTITGTVKAHQEYQGVMNTVMTRCKVTA